MSLVTCKVVNIYVYNIFKVIIKLFDELLWIFGRKFLKIWENYFHYSMTFDWLSSLIASFMISNKWFFYFDII